MYLEMTYQHQTGGDTNVGQHNTTARLLLHTSWIEGLPKSQGPLRGEHKNSYQEEPAYVSSFAMSSEGAQPCEHLWFTYGREGKTDI